MPAAERMNGHESMLMNQSGCRVGHLISVPLASCGGQVPLSLMRVVKFCCPFLLRNHKTSKVLRRQIVPLIARRRTYSFQSIDQRVRQFSSPKSFSCKMHSDFQDYQTCLSTCRRVLGCTCAFAHTHVDTHPLEILSGLLNFVP